MHAQNENEQIESKLKEKQRKSINYSLIDEKDT